MRYNLKSVVNSVLLVTFIVSVFVIFLDIRSCYEFGDKLVTNLKEKLSAKRLATNKNTASTVDRNENFLVKNSAKVNQRNNFYVFPNFIKPNRTIKYGETITLTTQADLRFLDNLKKLTNIWQGPISVALYAPGYDFFTALESVAYLRQCSELDLVKFVTFHLFFDIKHTPQAEEPLLSLYEDVYDCALGAPYENMKTEDMYKHKNNLLYPINVARNIARDAAQTHFVFPSDIELYPTPNFIEKFLTFVNKNPKLFDKNEKNVFVLPVFEMKEGYEIPTTKTVLQTMIKNKTAFLFHKNICTSCHKVIDGDGWLKEPETQGVNVFSVGKRQGKQSMWEPFYVCTHKEPLFDERLTWEGQGNKMSLAYSLCLLDYNFVVLDNAFLMHKPGVKLKKLQNTMYKNVTKEAAKLLKYHVNKELREMYGNNPKCKIY